MSGLSQSLRPLRLQALNVRTKLPIVEAVHFGLLEPSRYNPRADPDTRAGAMGPSMTSPSERCR